MENNASRPIDPQKQPPEPKESTLVAMLIGGLVSIVVGLLVVVIFI